MLVNLLKLNIMIRHDKEKIIEEIMDLRTLVGELLTNDNSDQINEIQHQINKIHNLVFGI